MSRRTKLQKEYHKIYGNYKGSGKYSDDYVRWLEDRVLLLLINNTERKTEQPKEILALIIDRYTEGNYLLSSSDRSRIISEILDLFSFEWRGEQLTAFAEWIKDNYSIDIPDRVIDDFKRYNS